ncbi:hypothetical protein MYCTH_89935 [Thermothelomyces thermophilus ATCC 42464]|uniref:Uncharacterized protein n=1 Tax=Thermothelomyces thermophilus (strain ATCC 42464 / BCRC 31852 / DSM 1799) TaxID=573729 RepID=G2Q1K3_THET4|nr:uncharacterized protein MYCTH_89935 [Thermothelomyces thermophilus ATCC 42464]AEO54994.1 hypothetical protein MYCTH_89935 [Thermothelomyces thermophilus ATCC 42464]
MVQNGGDFDLDIDMATNVTAEQLLAQLGQLQQRIQELDQRDKAAQARIKELENREKYSQKLEIAAIDETTKNVTEVAATSYEDKDSDTDSLGHDGNGEDEQAPYSELVTVDPETGLAEWDMAGEYAPPISILPILRQWGFTVTQRRDGSWTTDTQGIERPGPNALFLQERIEWYRNEVFRLNTELRERDGRLTRLAQQSDEMKDEMRELRRIVETIKGEQPVTYDGPDSYAEHFDDQQLSHDVRNPEYQFMRANRGKDERTWESYWKKHSYVSTGVPTVHVQWEGFGKEFQYLPGDATRLHPRHEAHAQVPWFQCVAHECRYHFRDKFENNHWPTRQENGDGGLCPVEWVYDAGNRAAELLWKIEARDLESITIVPRRAWPRHCGTGRDTWDSCWSNDCLYHADEKKLRIRELQMKLWHARRKAERTQWWEAASTQWLTEMSTIDEAAISRTTEEVSTDLGNGSGPFEGPGNH